MLLTKFINELKLMVPIIVTQKIQNEAVIVVSPKNLQTILFFLKNHISSQYKLLSCISGVDLLSPDYRFCISYDLLSIFYNNRIRVKVFLNEITPVPSIINIFINANWWEREIWDLYGIFFENHPDMRRILSDYGFEGYPMRKDFPLYGYIELRYDEKQKRVIAEPVEFAQEFRFFDFETPW